MTKIVDQEVSGWTSEDESIRWTRQADGSYAKEGKLAAEATFVRIFEIDEDYETNPHAVSSGKKMWLKEEAITLVERMIADGSYRDWRYELRPEMTSAETPPAQAGPPSEISVVWLCSNQRCKKGPNGTPGIVMSQRAKYCCQYCRVDACRRSRSKPEQVEEPKRKRRKDAKYSSHSERQRAYEAKHRTAHLPQAIQDLVSMKSRSAGMVATRVQEPA
jgi:hypothetical protein